MRIILPCFSLLCLVAGWEASSAAQAALAGDEPVTVTHVRSVYTSHDWQDPLVERTHNLGNFYWMPMNGETDKTFSSRPHKVNRTSTTKPQAISAPLPQPTPASKISTESKISRQTSTGLSYRTSPTDTTAVALSYKNTDSEGLAPYSASSVTPVTPASVVDSASSSACVLVTGQVVKASKKQIQPLKARALKLR